MVTVRCAALPGFSRSLQWTEGASSLRRGFLVLALWLAEFLELEFPCGPPGMMKWARGTRSRSRPTLSPCSEPLWAPLCDHSHPTLPCPQNEPEISVLKGSHLLTEGEHSWRGKGRDCRQGKPGSWAVSSSLTAIRLGPWRHLARQLSSEPACSGRQRPGPCRCEGKEGFITPERPGEGV